MPYTSDYLHTHDIDWFVIINGKLVHVASAGGSIPEGITKNLLLSVYYVANLPITNDVQEIETIKEDFLSNLLGLQTLEERENYMSTFKSIAQKGIYSFDRTNIEDAFDNNYHLVAWPQNSPAFISPRDLLLESNPILSIESNEINFDDPKILQDVNIFEIVEKGIKRPDERKG